MATEEEQHDECRMVVDAAMDVARDKCGSDEAVRRQLMDMFGFAADEDPPECPEVLDGGITESTLRDAESERRYAMCRAWDLVQNEDLSFRAAINRAWAEIRDAESEG